MTTDKGIIKFRCRFATAAAPPAGKILQMNNIRHKLYKRKFIGVDENGIGFGNISIRYDDSEQFIITGTQTGSKANLVHQDYSFVSDYEIKQNTIFCQGKIKASSESMSHAAIYKARNDINAVIHIHSNKIWRELLNKEPTTSPEFEYGTAELAEAIGKLCLDTFENIIILGGHQDGILIYGKNIQEAYVTILKTEEKIK